MSDQNGGKTETGEANSRPRSGSDGPSGSASGEHHVPPVIEGEAFDATAEHKPDPSETRNRRPPPNSRPIPTMIANRNPAPK